MERSTNFPSIMTMPISTELSNTNAQDEKYLKTADMWVLCLFTFVPAITTLGYSIYQCFYPVSKPPERSMGVLPVTLSLIASFLSANTIMGLPATINKEGLTFGWIVFTFPISMFIVTYFFLPVTYNLKIVDIFVYLELRFSHVMQKAGAFMFIILQLIYLSIVLRGPGILFQKVSGQKDYISIVIVGIVCSLYTALGGMKAGIYIEAFQSITMFLGLLVVVITTSSTSEINVFQNATETMLQKNGSLFFQTDNSLEYSIHSVLIGATVLYTAIYAVNQSQVQRYAACTSLKNAKISLWLNSLGLIIVIILCCLFGVQLIPYDIKTKKMDEAVGKFLMNQIEIEGVVGLFVAGVFSATMSSFSCGLSATNKVLFQNLLSGFKFSQRTTDLLHSIAAFFIGCFCTTISIFLDSGILKMSLSIYGALCCPILGVVILGMFFPWANKNAIYLSIGITVPFTLIYQILQILEINVKAINTLWYGPIAVTMVLTISIVGSKIFGFEDPSKVPSHLLSPIILKVLNKSPDYQKKMKLLEKNDPEFEKEDMDSEQSRMWKDDTESTA